MPVRRSSPAPYRLARFIVLSAILGVSGCGLWKSEEAEFNYLIGRGKSDITGPAAGVAMFGYGRQDQLTGGLHFRLYSRAFVIVDPQSGNRIAWVSADLGAAFHEIQRAVVARLRAQYGDLYTLQNTIVSATHTHSGPGGYSHYAAGSTLAGGFYAEHFEVIVAGIADSIRQAHESLAPGDILIARGRVEGAGANRSMEAYLANPEEERAKYDSPMDQTMTLLKFVTADGPTASLNWFAVHPTAMTFNNRLISGDHKGHGAALLEMSGASSDALGGASSDGSRDVSSGAGDDPGFVAAFANSNCGDITANLNLDNTGPGVDDFDSTRIIAERQYDVAAELFDSATEKLEGGLEYRHAFVDFSKLEVSNAYTGAGPQHTCPSAYGYTFAAGSTEDGGGHPLFKEGMKKRNPFIDSILATQFGAPSDELRACHLPKVILFAPGEAEPLPAQAQILPLGIVKIGQLVLAVVPAEVTTMAGRRMRDSIAAELNFDSSQIVLATYSNDYAGYVTTYEEYQTQQYEGGHTLYGPWTLAGYEQELSRLAGALAEGSGVGAGPTPIDLTDKIKGAPLGTEYDPAPEKANFGDTIDDVKKSYHPGDRVEVSFWTGHLQNDYQVGRNHLEVQRERGGEWTSVATDREWETRFYWTQPNAPEIDPYIATSGNAADGESVLSGPFTSVARITWDIPEGAPPGNYKVLYFGAYKSEDDGEVHRFTSESGVFQID